MMRTILRICTNKKPARDGNHFVTERRGKGDDTGDEHDSGLNPVAASFDRYGKTRSGITQNAALCDDVIVEGQNDGGAQGGEQSRKGLNQRLLHGL